MHIKKVTTLEELHELAKEVLRMCAQNESIHVLALKGDLGAGKTAFTKELGKILGIAEEITSPTFVIMKSYNIPSHARFRALTHIDAYRIESDDEMRVLRFEELLEDGTQLICIEWPEKIVNVIPGNILTVSLVLSQDGTREITYGI